MEFMQSSLSESLDILNLHPTESFDNLIITTKIINFIIWNWGKRNTDCLFIFGLAN